MLVIIALLGGSTDQLQSPVMADVLSYWAHFTYADNFKRKWTVLYFGKPEGKYWNTPSHILNTQVQRVLRRECVIAEITWFRHLSAEIASYDAFSAAAILPKLRLFGSRHLAAITQLRQKTARFSRLVGATDILWDSLALWNIGALH